eukprot:3140995-Pleurochrysis_carterae.AAC.4
MSGPRHRPRASCHQSYSHCDYFCLQIQKITCGQRQPLPAHPRSRLTPKDAPKVQRRWQRDLAIFIARARCRCVGSLAGSCFLPLNIPRAAVLTSAVAFELAVSGAYLATRLRSRGLSL